MDVIRAFLNHFAENYNISGKQLNDTIRNEKRSDGY
jgi:hypothetical protein